MSSLCRFLPQRTLGVCLLLSSIMPGLVRAQSADTAGAAEGLRDYLAAARQDDGRLWGHSLLGPMILVDPSTRISFASEQPPVGEFQQSAGLWSGTLPDSIGLANYALTWGERRWAMVLLPLSPDRFLRLELLLHEAFHGIQEQVGMGRVDRLNPHLDQRDGRYWLRLEVRAMAAALDAKSAARSEAARDAMRFRAMRLAEYAGADTLENALEIAEGLAEYTGTRLALAYLKLPESRAATLMRGFEQRKTFVRSLGYGTGPGLGLLLDGFRPQWKARVAKEGFAAQLAAALKVSLADSATAEQAARRYGGDSIAVEEDHRAEVRTRLLADYKARLMDGPVLRLTQSRLSRAFNPNELIPMDRAGTIYPTGVFNAEWGSIELTGGGALVSPDFTLLRLPAPAETTGATIHAEGYVLTLKPGWALVAGERAGDWTAVQR